MGGMMPPPTHEDVDVAGDVDLDATFDDADPSTIGVQVRVAVAVNDDVEVRRGLRRRR
jgi:hypothetical protein